MSERGKPRRGFVPRQVCLIDGQAYLAVTATVTGAAERHMRQMPMIGWAIWRGAVRIRHGTNLFVHLGALLRARLPVTGFR